MTGARKRSVSKRDAYRDAKWGGGVPGYSAFRTGLSYRAVVRMMRGMACRKNPNRLRALSRKAVLGFWHELKLQLWEQFLAAHDAQVEV